ITSFFCSEKSLMIIFFEYCSHKPLHVSSFGLSFSDCVKIWYSVPRIFTLQSCMVYSSIFITNFPPHSHFSWASNTFQFSVDCFLSGFCAFPHFSQTKMILGCFFFLITHPPI